MALGVMWVVVENCFAWFAFQSGVVTMRPIIAAFLALLLVRAPDVRAVEPRDRVASLIKALNGPGAAKRADAAKTLGLLGAMGQRHPEAIVPLTGALKAEDKEVRRWAAYALCQHVVDLAKPPRELIPALLRGLEDPEQPVRTYCAAAFTHLGPAGIPDLVKLLQGKEDVLRGRAAHILGTMGAMGRRHPEVIGPLAEALQAKDKEVRRWAAYALCRHVDDNGAMLPRGLIPALTQGLKDPEERVRTYCAATFVGLGRLAVPDLIKLLKCNEDAVRTQAARILGQMGAMGQRHRQAIPALQEALKADDKELRRWAAYALGQIDIQP
jgi:HEAT repeat protein